MADKIATREAYGKALVDLGNENGKVVVLDADLAGATMTMHFKAGEHHHPPCKPAADMQKTMLSAVGAALLALMAAVGSVIAEILRR